MSEGRSDSRKVVDIMAAARKSIEQLTQLDHRLREGTRDICDVHDIGEVRSCYLRATSIWCKAYAEMQNIAFSAWVPDVRMVRVATILDFLERLISMEPAKSCSECGNEVDGNSNAGMLIKMLRSELNTESAELNLSIEVRRWADKTFGKTNDA